MTAEDQQARCFDPSRDVAAMSDAFLRQHGINGRGSIPFFRDLARLVPADHTTLRMRSWSQLADALIRLRGDDRGLRHKQRIDDKLGQLAKQGLIELDGYEVTFQPPESWRPRETPERETEFRCVAADERQGSLFAPPAEPECTTFRVFGSDTEEAEVEPETESAFGFQESAFPEKPKALSVLDGAPHTSYPRARAVDVVDVDVVVSTVEESEIQEARSALQRTIASWKKARIPERQWKPERMNYSTWLKTHTLLVRDRISQDQFADAVDAVRSAHDSTGIRKSVWAILWERWNQTIPSYGQQLRSMTLPPGWHDLLAAEPEPEATHGEDGWRPRRATPDEVAKHEAELKRLATRVGRRAERAPNGEHVERE